MAKSKLEKEIYKAVNRGMRNASEEIGFMIEGIFQKVIDAFYLDYEPNSYQRTYSSYDAYEKELTSIPGRRYITGITVGGKYIKGNPYNADDAEWVFDRTYKGIHGQTFSEQQKAKRKGYVFRDKNGHFVSIVSSSKLRGDLTSRAIARMSPSPKRMMATEFKRLKRNREINRIVQSEIEKELLNIKF